MDHYAFPSIDSFVEKHNRYSNWEAVVESSAEDDETALQHDGVKGKRRLRKFFENCPFGQPFAFFMYIFGKKESWTGGEAIFLRDYMHSTNSYHRRKPKPF
jgi:hypothetical protein